MAYVREKKVPGKDGKEYRYYYLVEGKRVDGKVRQRVIRYLGKHDSMEAAREAAGVVPKSADVEQDGRYWITYPFRLGYDSSAAGVFSKPMFPVFLSKEAAQEYGGRGDSDVAPEVLGFGGPELAATLRGARLGANHIAIWGADYRKAARDQKPEILSRRAFMKRLESAAN